jgi:integrase
MASIYQRKSKRTGKSTYYILYRITVDGKRIKKQFKCEDRQQAHIILPEVKKAESENREFTKYEISTAYSNSKAITVDQLINEYIDSASTGYNTKRKPWSPTTRSSNIALTRNYISPYIGQEKITTITPQYLKAYIDDLLKQDMVKGNHKSSPGKVTARIIEDILKILRPAFKLGVVFYGLPYNPVREISAPHTDSITRTQWGLEEFIQTVNECTDDYQMKVMMVIMVACTLRSCELCGLTWDCVDISGKSITSESCSIYIDKEAIRLKDVDVQRTNSKIYLRFPKQKTDTKTSIYLKEPKTSNSIRKIYIPNSVARMLQKHKDRQNDIIQKIGNAYHNYNLVFPLENGNPFVSNTLGKRFKRYLSEHNHPNPVDFYSLRHTSITLKLKTTNNLKAIQGDSGHSTMDMIEDHYWGLHQEDRIEIARNMDNTVFKNIKDDNS